MSGLLDELAVALAEADWRSVVDLFSDSDEVIMVGSEAAETAVGRSELTRLWRRVLSRGQKYQWNWSLLRTVQRGHLAWVYASATVSVESSSGVQEMEYRATLVVERQGADWKILMYHGAEPAEAWAEAP